MLDFKSLLEKETPEIIEITESNYLKILDDGYTDEEIKEILK